MCTNKESPYKIFSLGPKFSWASPACILASHWFCKLSHQLQDQGFLSTLRSLEDLGIAAMISSTKHKLITLKSIKCLRHRSSP